MIWLRYSTADWKNSHLSFRTLNRPGAASVTHRQCQSQKCNISNTLLPDSVANLAILLQNLATFQTTLAFVSSKST